MGRLRDSLGWLEHPVADARLHMTLGISCDFDNLPEHVVAQMLAIGASTKAEPVRVTLSRLAASPESIALRLERSTRELNALGGQLAGRLVRAGIARPDWRFSPHVRLGYRRGEPFGRKISAIEWESRHFVLIHSIVGRQTHEELARWPLTARQPALPLVMPGLNVS
jgi:RNA 2',3'-cyclic 3'-phosphodiesterase